MPGYTVHGNGFPYKRSVQGNAGVVDFLVDAVFVPDFLGKRKTGELLLYFGFRFHIAGIVDFEARPLFRRIARKVSGSSAVRFGWLTGDAKITDEFFSLGQFLPVQPQYGSAPLERKRQTHIGRPYHGAVPGDRGEVVSGFITEQPGEANALKIRIESALDDCFIFQCGQNMRRNFLAACEVNHRYGTAVNGITEEQNLKIRRFRISVDAAFCKVHTAEGFDIDTDCFHLRIPFRHRRQRGAPTAAGFASYGRSFMRFSRCFLQARKSSSSSVAKSDSALALPPSGSPSRIFCRLFSPQAMPRFPLLLKA